MGYQHRSNLMIVAFTLSAVVVGGIVFDNQLVLAVKGSKPMNLTRITVEHVRVGRPVI
jgi:hypothetical protein